MPELACVWLAALRECRRQFRMFARFQIAAQQQIMGHPRESRYAAVTRIEGALQRGQRKRAALRDLQRILARSRLQLLIGYDAVNQANLEGLVRGDLWIPVPDVLGALLPNQILQVPGAIAGIETADHGTDLAEDGGFFGDTDVADHLQYVAAAYCESVDRGDDRLLQAVDAFIHIQRGQHPGIQRGVRHAVLAST